jgi:rhodanese-related sulfurtransferase
MGKKLAMFCGVVLICNLLLFGILPISTDADQEVLEIPADEAAERVVNGRFDVILDVRQSEEYKLLHIPGAVPMPLNTLKEGVREKLSNPAASILIYCSVGGRSLEAVKILKDMGYPNAVSLEGGIAAWDEKSYPVAK